jgi:hypothetical protein
MNTNSLHQGAATNDTINGKTQMQQIVVVPQEAQPRSNGYDWQTLIGQVAWPLAVLLIVFLFRKGIVNLLDSLGDMIRKIRSGKFGNVEWSTLDTGRSNAEQAPVANGAILQFELTREAKKVLSTLWNYQKQFEAGFERGKVWTFLVYHQSPQYGEFVAGCGRLLEKGLIAWRLDTGQFHLTPTGIHFCREREADLGEDRYTFQ